MKISPFVFLCATGLFAIFSSTLSKSPVLPLFAAHLGADPSAIGFVAAISAFAGIAFSVPAGLLADRFGTKRLILASSLVFASAPFGYLFVTNIWQLALIRFYHGFATAIFLPVAMALVSTLSHKERGEKLGWFSIFTSFYPLLCLSVVFGLCLSVVTSATSAYIADLSSQQTRGSAMGILGSIMDIGHASGPLLSGVIAASFGYAQSFLGASLVLLAVTLFYFFSMKPFAP